MIEGNHNIEFLQKIEPRKLILWAFLFWGILFFTSPLTLRINLNPEAFLLLFLCVLSFLLGTLLSKKRRSTIKTIRNEISLQKLFNYVLIISVIGISFKYFDRFYIRGISFGADIFSNRESMGGGSGNVIGILSSILAPFSFFPLFLFWKYKLKLSFIVKLLVHSVFVLQVFDSILLGSRSGLFVIFVFLLFYLMYFRKIRFTIKKLALSISLIVGFMLLMNYMFIERTKVFAGDDTYDIVLNQSNFNFTVTANQHFKHLFDKQEPIVQNILFTYITTSQYFTHGMFEFSYLYDHFKKEHALGSYTFSVYSRFIKKITGQKENLDQLEKLAPRTGVYTTLFGPLYLDFGWFILVFMMLFGFYSQAVYQKSCRGEDPSILIYFYIAIVLMFAPVFNFINGAGGIFLFTSFLLLNIFSNKMYKA